MENQEKHPKLDDLLKSGPERMNRSPRGGHIIYALVSPDDEVLYIGYTRNLEKRLMYHQWAPDNPGVSQWVEDGRSFRGVVLDTATARTWDRCERDWIACGRRLGKLFNIQAGGRYARMWDGGYVMLPPMSERPKKKPKSKKKRSKKRLRAVIDEYGIVRRNKPA